MLDKVMNLLPKQMPSLPSLPAFVQAMSPIQQKVAVAVAVAFVLFATAICCIRCCKARRAKMVPASNLNKDAPEFKPSKIYISKPKGAAVKP